MPAPKNKDAAAAAYDRQHKALRKSSASSSLSTSATVLADPLQSTSASALASLAPLPPPKEPLPPILGWVEDDVVPLLPLAQPYTSEFGIDRTILVVAFHYGLSDAAISTFAACGVLELRHFRLAAGDQDMLAAVVAVVDSPLQKHLLEPFLIHLDQVDPLAPLPGSLAVVGVPLVQPPSAAPPSKGKGPAKSKSAASNAVAPEPAASGSAAMDLVASGSSASDKRSLDDPSVDPLLKKSHVVCNDIGSSKDFSFESDQDASQGKPVRWDSEEKYLARSLQTYGSHVTLELCQHLVDVCQERMVGEDSGSYDTIFDIFRQLITSLLTRGQTGNRNGGVAHVKAQLKEFLARCTAHSHKYPGTVRVIFGEMSGMAGSAIICWLDKALWDVATKDGPKGVSRGESSGDSRFNNRPPGGYACQDGEARSGGRRSRRPLRQFDPKVDKCFRCQAVGHLARDCKNPPLKAITYS
jgi:hypothetical protein